MLSCFIYFFKNIFVTSESMYIVMMTKKILRKRNNEWKTKQINCCFYTLYQNIFDKFNNAYHSSIKTKPIDVKSNSYAKHSVYSQR